MKNILLIISLLFVVFFVNRCTRPELYTAENKFQEKLVVNNKIRAKIEDFNWYAEEYTDSYYVFTDKGALFIDANGGNKQDERLSDRLEEYTGLVCTLYLDTYFTGKWFLYNFDNCTEDNRPEPQNINSDVPTSSPIVYESDVPTSSPNNYSDIPN